MMNVLENEVKVVPTAAELEAGLQCDFKRAQDMHTSAFHIQGLGGKVLCGATDIFLGTKELTVEGVMLSLPRQNGAWFWCAKCAAAFTGESEEFFLESRYVRKGIHH